MSNPTWRLIASILCVVCVSLAAPSRVSLADETKTDNPKQAKAPKAAQKPALFGRITDVHGNAVTDAKLTLMGPNYFNCNTDADGRYEFVDVDAPGSYRLQIESQKWIGITDYRKMQVLVIDPDKSIEKNLTLKRACVVKLTVVDEAGDPVSATITYRSPDTTRYSGSQQKRTDKEGVATIGGLEPTTGQYLFGVQSKQHAPGRLLADVTDPNENYEHKIVLKKGKTIKGIMLCKDGQPATGWHAYALPTWWKFGTHPRGSVIGKDGSFELNHVGNENYSVSVSIPLGDRMTTSIVSLPDANLHDMKQPVDFQVDYASPSSMDHLICKIRWIGKPLDEGFRISGYSAELEHHFDHYIKKGEKEVKIGPVPRGTYRLRPEHAAIEVMNLRKIKNLTDLNRVKVPGEEPLQIVLRVRGKPHVQGTVVDAKTKKPITSFQYRVSKLRTLQGPNYTQTDDWQLGKSEDGSFEYELTGAGIYTVSVLAPGYGIETSKQVNTIESPDEILPIELKPEVTLRGKVVDTSGAPINGAKVRALSLACGAMSGVHDKFTTETGAVQTKNGEFAISGLKAGYDSIRIDHPEFVHHIDITQIAAGSEPLKITLSKGATIRGRCSMKPGNRNPTRRWYSKTARATAAAVTKKPVALAKQQPTKRGDTK